MDNSLILSNNNSLFSFPQFSQNAFLQLVYLNKDLNKIYILHLVGRFKFLSLSSELNRIFSIEVIYIFPSS